MRRVQIVRITRTSALILGASGETLRGLGIPLQWCSPLGLWAIPADRIADVGRWARNEGRGVEVVDSVMDR